MSATGGIFNIIQRGQFSTAALQSLRAPTQQKTTDEGHTNPLTWSLKRNESAVAAYWRLAPDAAAKNSPSQEIVKRLEKMADGDNKDIAAEKMRQAKAKLEGLRRQLQMLAANGDVRQLRRIAAEAARLAREIGSAARSMAQGIGAGTTTNETAGAQATMTAANTAIQSAGAVAEDSEEAPASGGSEPQGTLSAAGDREGAYKALHELTSDARNAVTQAKGIIALAAQMIRARRKNSDDDDDRYFRGLQEEADRAFAEIDAGQREALGDLLGLGGGSGGVSGFDVFSSSVSIEITVETFSISTTHVEVVA